MKWGNRMRENKTKMKKKYIRQRKKRQKRERTKNIVKARETRNL